MTQKLPNKSIRGLLFDLDGVIVSTEHNHFIAWQKIAVKLGVNFGEKENEKLKGLSRADSLRAILSLGGIHLEPAQFEALMAEKNANYLDSISDLSGKDLLPGVISLLAKARKAGLKLGVGSASRNTPRILQLLGITDYFDIVVDGTMVANPKPNPEVFVKGAAAIGLAPEECIVFEDASSGIKAALDGGFFAIAVGNKEIATLGHAYFNDLTEFKLEDYAKLV